jgi:hypothetical protein
MSEVDEQPEAEAGRLQIVEDLCAVFVGQFPHRLQLNDDPLETYEIRLAHLLECPAFVRERQFGLSDERNALQLELDRQALLVRGFEESAPLCPCTPRSTRP